MITVTFVHVSISRERARVSDRSDRTKIMLHSAVISYRYTCDIVAVIRFELNRQCSDITTASKQTQTQKSALNGFVFCVVPTVEFGRHGEQTAYGMVDKDDAKS